MKDLPYIYVDNELDFNAAVLLLILDKLAFNSKNKPKLDFEKLQVFLYLVRNPSKINKVLNKAGENTAFIEDQHTHTIESLSVNVDILYDRARLKTLLQRLTISGSLGAVRDESNCIFYFLTDKGKVIAGDLTESYFHTINSYLKSFKSLQSLSSSKLFSLLNLVFQEN